MAEDKNRNTPNNNSDNKGFEKDVNAASSKPKMPQQDPDDLPDSERDMERLQPETTIINLPDVDDIPGQEHIHVPSLGEISDTTISSDDEEGEDIFDNDKNTRDS
ncbi:MAG: hypothetical protein ACTHJ5_05780 [Ilyomonas sp.]